MSSPERVLPKIFFSRCPEDVAPALLGKLLVRRLARTVLRARIVEVEAYLGLGDLAAHAARGMTARNAVLFGPPGRAYIYVSYGQHLCLNISTQPAGTAGCVLIRALEPVDGLRQMLRNAPTERSDRVLSGPGRLTHALAIPLTLNGHDLTRPGELYLTDGNNAPSAIAVTQRIGITKSVELPLRFYVEGSKAVSARKGPILRTVGHLDLSGD